MRVAVYKDNLSTGRGADRAVRNFASGLAERGHDVALMEKAEFMAKVGGAKPSNGAGFDVIVATGSNEIADLDAAGYFSRPQRAKVVLQLHLAPRGFFKWRHPLRNRRIRKAFDKADAVQVLCSSYAEEFRRMAPHPAVEVIGNYTEMDASGFPLSAERHARPVILYPAASLNGVKNQKLLIEAFALVAAEFPEWKVRLLGKDTTPYAESCRRLLKAKGLEGRVQMVGFTDRLADEYAGASFIAFPSTLEGFPLAILEAARFSLAAVAQSALPGVEDIVVSGETGIVTSPDPAAYAGGLRRMMADGSLRRSLGEKARKRAEETYSRSKILDQWETLLGNVI